MLSQRATLGGWVLTECLLLVQSRQAVQSDRLGVPAPGRQRVLLPQIPSLCRYYTISPAPAIPSASNFYWCRRYAMFACVAITIRTSDCSALRPSKIALKLSTCVRYVYVTDFTKTMWAFNSVHDIIVFVTHDIGG